MAFNLKHIKRILLFGGGQILADFALMLKANRFDLFIATGERHAQEVMRIDGESFTFEEFLKKNELNFAKFTAIAKDPVILNQIDQNTLGFSISAPWIFRQPFIDRFEGRLLNMHGARLPQYRGAASFSWQILRDEREGSMVIHQVDAGVDTGPIVKTRKFSYTKDCFTPEDYLNHNIKQGRELFKEFIADMLSGKKFAPRAQDESQSMYWPRLSTEKDGYIDWTWSPKHLELFVRAFSAPYKGASCYLGDQRIFIRRCSKVKEKSPFHPFQAGLIYRKTAQGVFVAVNQGSLLVTEVNDERGGDALSFLNVGDRFHTPTHLLENAFAKRTFFSAKGVRRNKEVTSQSASW
jgi:methionyl-tRNA formyltransferase